MIRTFENSKISNLAVAFPLFSFLGGVPILIARYLMHPTHLQSDLECLADRVAANLVIHINSTRTNLPDVPGTMFL